MTNGHLEPYRALKTTGHMHGRDIEALRDSCDRRLHRHGAGKYACGPGNVFDGAALAACERALWMLGGQKGTLQLARSGELSIGAQRVIRHPDQARSATNVEIAKYRAREFVKREHAHALANVTIVGNKVTGGTPRERVVAAIAHAEWLWATGRSHRYYSMLGAWNVDCAITGPPPGCRDDCSSWFIGSYKAAGLPDPANTGYRYGNTATLWDAGHEIPLEELRGGDGVIYSTDGTAAGSHHIEAAYRPPITIGHGDAAVNRGTVLEMPGAHGFRFIDD